jgi:hypothetical protein
VNFDIFLSNLILKINLKINFQKIKGGGGWVVGRVNIQKSPILCVGEWIRFHAQLIENVQKPPQNFFFFKIFDQSSEKWQKSIFDQQCVGL